MSRSATPATRNAATRRLKPPKTTPSAELHRHGHTALTRTVADGCGRLRTVADVNATSSEHTLNPQTPRVKREPLLRIREKTFPRNHGFLGGPYLYDIVNPFQNKYVQHFPETMVE